MSIIGDLRIALWQCEPGDSVDGNLARLRETAATAADAGARLLIAPEMFISGYNIDAATARERSDRSGGPVSQAVGDIARDAGLAILYGCPELGSPDDPADDAVRNTIRLVERDGHTAATHHKTHLFGDVDAEAVTAGELAPPVVELDGWLLGLLICYEVEFPELARSLAVRRADVLCVPTANMPEFDAVQTVLLPARALENQVFVAYANLCGAEEGLRYGGLSEVIGPDGGVIARAGRDPALIYADLSREQLNRSREKFPYLRDRRPEIY